MRRRKKKGADIKLLSYTDCVFHENVEDSFNNYDIIEKINTIKIGGV